MEECIGYFAAAFLSVVASAAAAMIELRASGVALNGAVVSISAAVFVTTAIIEGLITVAVMQTIGKLNPGWVADDGYRRPTGLWDMLAGVAVLLMAARSVIHLRRAGWTRGA